MHWFLQIYWFEQIFWFQLCPFFQCPSIIFSHSYQWWCNCQRHGGLLYITYRLELFVRVQQVTLTSCGAAAKDTEASCTSHTSWNYFSESNKLLLKVVVQLPETGRPPVHHIPLGIICQSLASRSYQLDVLAWNYLKSEITIISNYFKYWSTESESKGEGERERERERETSVKII